jgi:hypothetical protein
LHIETSAERQVGALGIGVDDREPAVPSLSPNCALAAACEAPRSMTASQPLPRRAASSYIVSRSISQTFPAEYPAESRPNGRYEQLIRWTTDFGVPQRPVLSCASSRSHLLWVDELRLVIGMTDELQQDLAPLLTVYSRAGEVDRQVATAAVLGAPAEMGDRLAASQRDARENGHVIATAVAAQADLLVSGDHHVLAIGDHQGIRIVTPAEAVRLVAARPEQRP